ncbi:Hypothetical predicted protein [Octopus vulgaris]|uniref:Uncharacterized protein n=1 Tax=Octopus vulgaris TaxID=6645 RepID=A0AA36B775_OCTVU|nr:Hypothetical predicted protein [Octopus vulgaris]
MRYMRHNFITVLDIRFERKVSSRILKQPYFRLMFKIPLILFLERTLNQGIGITILVDASRVQVSKQALMSLMSNKESMSLKKVVKL